MFYMCFLQYKNKQKLKKALLHTILFKIINPLYNLPPIFRIPPRRNEELDLKPLNTLLNISFLTILKPGIALQI